MELKKEIEKVSQEISTPDYLIEEYLLDCLSAYETAVKSRDEHENASLNSGGEQKPCSKRVIGVCYDI